MLNLNRQVQALTQGQSQGKRVVARAVQIEEVSVPGEEPSSPTGGATGQAPAAPGTDGVSPEAVARRVYELMRQDLRVELERRKPGR